MNQNLYRLLMEGESRDPDGPCLINCGGTLSRRSITEGAARVARLLRDRGVKPGNRVMVQAPKTPETLMLYLATLKIGAVYAPLNTAYTKAELSHFISDASPQIFVDDAAAIAREARSFDPIDEVQERFGDDLAALIYTSGTTGRSKGAMLSHGAMAANAETLVSYWEFDASDVLLHALPIFHVHGLFVANHCALISGAPMIWLDKFDEGAVVAALPVATVMMGVPTFYTRLLKRPDFTRDKTSKIRLFISGSAALSPATFQNFEERTGHRILERFGMSEAGMITSNPLRGDRVPGSVGYPLPGVDVRVTGGDVGQIEIKGPNLFSGYWGMPEKTREEFTSDGYFITGDLGSQDADGRLWISGRAKELIISGGYNIYPKEIELVLDRCPGVQESGVFGLPDADFGEAVAAALVLESELRAGQVEEFLRESIAGFKVPKKLFVVDALPRNALGKVQKHLLLEVVLAGQVEPLQN